jgi:hypothetical protein
MRGYKLDGIIASGFFLGFFLFKAQPSRVARFSIRLSNNRNAFADQGRAELFVGAWDGGVIEVT